MIRLTGVTKRFDQLEVVSNVNLTIEPGEILGFLGPNGAGKTTTIRMIAGVLPPTEGEVTINDQQFSTNEHELKRMIGYLPENNPLYDELTVEEHLTFWAAMKNVPETEQADAITFAVDKTGIAEVYYRFISELSKGYRQRVGLAQAILSRPQILLLDEPTEGLDPNQRRDIQELLSSLKKERTVIVASHVLGEITKLANRVVIIHNGRVVGDDTPQNLTRATKGLQQVRVEIDGSGIRKALKAIDGVESVNKDGDEYVVAARTDDDVRAAIFSLAVKQKWTLLSMYQESRKLEDVFSELTEN